jgi:predicted metal-dependent HD superfamily phosphohydrolase
MDNSDDLATRLLPRWRAVWRVLGAADEGGYVYADLVVRYAEPHRAYHSLGHVDDCLYHLDVARHWIKRPAETELALWFHDAVYDPQRADNEEQAARLAEEVLSSNGLEPDAVWRIGELIRLTTHERDDLTGDAAMLCDIDLTILGASPEHFDRYDSAIRREYDWVPEEVFRIERGRVLARFLERPRIYQTPFFRGRLEKQARANLLQALRRYR